MKKVFVVGIRLEGMMVPMAIFQTVEEGKTWVSKPDSFFFDTLCFEMEEGGEMPLVVSDGTHEYVVMSEHFASMISAAKKGDGSRLKALEKFEAESDIDPNLVN